MRQLIHALATTALILLQPLGSASAQGAGPSVERGKQIVGAVCVACHGADGNSPTSANPNLAGQGEQYIVTQLKAFKKGSRDNAIMKGFASALSDEDMVSVAMYLSRQIAKPGSATDKALAQRGQELYRAGSKRLEVPACAGCHGPAGQGIPAQYPRLAGQYAEYTYEELNAYATGARANSVMGAIAKRLSDTDRKALAQYVAGLREVR